MSTNRRLDEFKSVKDALKWTDCDEKDGKFLTENRSKYQTFFVGKIEGQWVPIPGEQPTTEAPKVAEEPAAKTNADLDSFDVALNETGDRGMLDPPHVQK